MTRLGELLAPVVLVAIIALSIQSFWSWLNPPPYEPLKLMRFQVKPDTIQIGEYASLLDGVCNRSEDTVSAAVYLGAQRSVATSVTIPVIDLLRDSSGQSVRDTPEGRLRRSFEPGCTITDPITTPVPAVFTPGDWVLRIHIVVTGPEGQVQDISATSNIFTVEPAR